MEEKIKLYVPNNVYQVMLKDMELFEFFKKDRSLNRNDFLNRLIVNYYETYSENVSNMYDHITKVLIEAGHDDFEAGSLASDIIGFTEKQSLDLENRKSDVVISMKPTKYSSQAFDYIESFLLKGSSLSGWLRNLFASYVRLPQDKRERIIFKENFEVIESAIEQHKKLYFTSSTNKNIKHIVDPYSLSNSKEELFNYLIAQEKGNAYSFRVSRIANLAVLNEEAVFSDDIVSVFKKMEIYGPQFSYALSENKTIKVRFTDRGKALYEKIYLHRPQYTKIDGDIYEFECSTSQMTQYLQRFGKHAVVIEPENLRVDLEIYYVNAYQAYKNQGKVNKLTRQKTGSKDI